MKLSKIRDLTVDNVSHPGRPSHVSAASGLVRVGATLYVVADDELHLGVFSAEGDAPGHLLRMRAGDLPTAAKARKKVKPDFEALVYLPGFGQFSQSALLALGSGSRKSRCLGVLIPLNGEVPDVQMARPIDASELFSQLATEVDELNVEGALVLDDRLLLLHRGNKSHAHSAIFTIDLTSARESMYSKGVLSALPILAVSHYDLGLLDGIPLCFTDGAALSNGRVAFSAVAEDTFDSYLDGPCAGSAFGIIGADGSLEFMDLLDTRLKIEGIHAQEDGPALNVWLVSDADDVEVPAALLFGTLPVLRCRAGKPG